MYQKPEKAAGGTNISASVLTIGRYYQRAGLQLALYRAYDAELGRWLNEDPIGERGGINLYRFVSNQPVSRADARGLGRVNANAGLQR